VARDWRWRFLNLFGPGAYPGFVLGDWLRLLRDNRFSVSPAYFFRAASACLFGLTNSAIAQVERWRYEDEIATTMPTLRSQYLSILFPHRAAFYDRYLTFREVPPQEIGNG